MNNEEKKKDLHQQASRDQLQMGEDRVLLHHHQKRYWCQGQRINWKQIANPACRRLSQWCICQTYEVQIQRYSSQKKITQVCQQDW